MMGTKEDADAAWDYMCDSREKAFERDLAAGLITCGNCRYYKASDDGETGTCDAYGCSVDADETADDAEDCWEE